MDDIATKYLVLDITTNLSRIGRFSLEGNDKRVDQFMGEMQEYLEEIDKRELPPEFARTYSRFKEVFEMLSRKSERDRNFADDAFTYSSILTHRASLLEG